MAENQTQKPSKQAIETSQQVWDGFLKASKICGGITVIILIGMAIFLV